MELPLFTNFLLGIENSLKNINSKRLKLEVKCKYTKLCNIPEICPVQCNGDKRLTIMTNRNYEMYKIYNLPLWEKNKML